MTDHPRAVGYFRVSSKEQATDLHVSLPTQREKFLSYSSTRKYITGEEYTDVESGRLDSRKAYQRMLAAARSNAIDVIVVQRLDRFGRNPREILRRIWELQDLGITVEAVDEDLQSEISVMLHAFMAGEESKRISARVIPTQERVIREGRWIGNAPFGYQLVQDKTSPLRGKLLIDEREAATVRRIFELYAAGHLGWSKVAEILNDDRAPAPRHSLWWASTVEVILRNAAYIGRPTWRGLDLAGGCPPIVELETWTRVQTIIAERKLRIVRKPPGEAFLLAGLVRCACGTYRAGWTVFRDNYVDRKGHRRRPSPYYRCAHAANAHSCKVGLIPAKALDAWVLDQVRAWRIPAIEGPIPDDSADRRAQLAGQRTALKAKIERLRRRRDVAYDQLMDGVITKDDYRANDRRYLEEIDEYEHDLRELRDIRDQAPDPAAAIALLASFQRQVDALPPDRLRTLLGELVVRIDVVNRSEWRIVAREELMRLLTC